MCVCIAECNVPKVCVVGVLDVVLFWLICDLCSIDNIATVPNETTWTIKF